VNTNPQWVVTPREKKLVNLIGPTVEPRVQLTLRLKNMQPSIRVCEIMNGGMIRILGRPGMSGMASAVITERSAQAAETSTGFSWPIQVNDGLRCMWQLTYRFRNCGEFCDKMCD
jgi:hypothetical protein